MFSIACLKPEALTDPPSKLPLRQTPETPNLKPPLKEPTFWRSAGMAAGTTGAWGMDFIESDLPLDPEEYSGIRSVETQLACIYEYMHIRACLHTYIHTCIHTLICM